MKPDPAVARALALDLLNHVERTVLEADEAGHPLEVPPYRERLFELFSKAWESELVDDESDPDLTADGLCQSLATRWGLADSTRKSFESQQQLEPEQLARMRLMWSLMRMWMEWNYAWCRWQEFHQDNTVTSGEA